MEWRDEGIILQLKKQGENNILLSILTAYHGRWKGIVKRTRKNQVLLQPGSMLSVRWNARLSEHLGQFNVEALPSCLALILEDVERLSALNAVCGMCEICLPEREDAHLLYPILRRFIMSLHQPYWRSLYLEFELALLQATGFTLDFSKCVVTGQVEDLCYLSPKSGRAVSRKAGEPYHDKLFLLPDFFLSLGKHEINSQEMGRGLNILEYFFQRYFFSLHDIVIPAARDRFKQLLVNSKKS